MAFHIAWVLENRAEITKNIPFQPFNNGPYYPIIFNTARNFEYFWALLLRVC